MRALHSQHKAHLIKVLWSVASRDNNLFSRLPGIEVFMWLEFISMLMFGFIISKFSNLFCVLLFSWVVPGLYFSYIIYSGYVICLFFSTNYF